MDFSAIGKRIKDLRKLLGLSQEELAKDICTQAQISKIEKGDAYPFANTLYLISQRLGVDVNYFFDIGTTPRLDYVQEVIRQLTLTRRNSRYEEMDRIVKAEEKNPLFTENLKHTQMLLWHKGISQYMLNRNMSEAMQTLKEAISITHTIEKLWTEREIEVLLSMGSVLFEEQMYNESLQIYLDANESLQQLPFLQDNTIISRLYYNISRVLTRLSKYHESISYCEKAILWCINKDNLYLLGELHYHIGYNLELQENVQEARLYYEKACIIFDLQQDNKYIAFIKQKLDAFCTV